MTAGDVAIVGLSAVIHWGCALSRLRSADRATV